MYDEVAGEASPILTIANEFADVKVWRAVTRNGVRLAICSPRRGTSILLDAVGLDCLSWQDPDLITRLLDSDTVTDES